MTAALVEVSDLVIEYNAGGYPVRPIDGLNLTAAAGELIVLLGPSGCGKTSLLSAIGGLLAPRSGAIRVGGTDIHGLSSARITTYRQRQVGFVFQAFNLIPSLSARENVAVPLMLAGTPRVAALDRADLLLERVGLGEQTHRRPGRLSGGQQQRVAVARALAADPPLLLADEPTANLDYVHAEGIISLLRDLRADGRTIIVSTHDDRIAPIADRVVHLVPDFRADAEPPHEVEAGPGEVIFQIGDRGELVYVVIEGHVDIVRPGSGGDDLHIAACGPGEYFGELGPLLGFPRSATAVSRVQTRMRAMGVSDFRKEFQQPPGPQ